MPSPRAANASSIQPITGSAHVNVNQKVAYIIAKNIGRPKNLLVTTVSMASEISRLFWAGKEIAPRHAPAIIAYLLSAMNVGVSSIAWMADKCFICLETSFQTGCSSGIFIVQVSLSRSFMAKNRGGIWANFSICNSLTFAAIASIDSSKSFPYDGDCAAWGLRFESIWEIFSIRGFIPP